jgi:hypothetical protein
MNVYTWQRTFIAQRWCMLHLAILLACLIDHAVQIAVGSAMPTTLILRPLLMLNGNREFQKLLTNIAKTVNPHSTEASARA